MKKFILASLTALTTTLSFGQTSLGIKAGLNVANTKGFNYEAKPILAEHVGAYANSELRKRFFLRTELLYTMKGYKFPAWGMYNKGSFKSSYVALPALLGLRTTDNISILLGAEVGYLLKAKFHYADSTSSNLHQYNKVDFALAIGADYRFHPRLSAEARYNYGFKDLLTIPYSDQSGNHTRTVGAHRVFQLSLNYRLSKSR